MSKSVPLCTPLRTVCSAELIKEISATAGVSYNATKVVMETLTSVIVSHLMSGEAVNLRNFATFHLRRRNFSEERRRKFTMNSGILPEFSYYPYAEMSTPLRKQIAEHKFKIAEILSNVKTYRQQQEEANLNAMLDNKLEE